MNEPEKVTFNNPKSFNDAIEILYKQIEESAKNTVLEKMGKDASYDQSIIEDAIDDIKRTLLKTIRLEIKEQLASPLYIPTERIFTASISDFLFNFIQSKINLADCVVNFGARFEKARKELPNYRIPIFDDLVFSSNNNINYLQLSNNKTIKFTQSSSGMQASIPMLMVFDLFCEKTIPLTIVVEEPELNLYPSTQKKAIEYLTTRVQTNDHKLVVTTHSPYIITSIANLIEAKNTADANPEAIEEIKQIIPEYKWLDFDNVSAYYVVNGTAKDILDYENKTIDANAIDDVSDEIAQEFDALLDIKYRE